jgi:catechol 2,3-dioxygenase-like lactoylglutathione lyase family enzyme
MRQIARLTILALCCTFNSLSQQAISSASPPDSFRLPRVGYVMLGVANVQNAIDFYHGKLGLPVTRQSDDLAFFDAGAISIVVSSEIGKTPGDSETVFAVDHVQAAFESLNGRGIHFDLAPHQLSEVAWAASFRDPDGHVLSLYGPR